jgi:hypothetical protein
VEDGVGDSETGAGVVSGIAPLRTLRASQRLKAIVDPAITPTTLIVIHGVATIEANIDDTSLVDPPFLILWSRLKLVEVK